MAELIAYEKQLFEEIFEMHKTTVLNMDRDEFIFFVGKYIDIDLDDFEEYKECNSADLFRKMWGIETDYTIAVTLEHLLEWYIKHKYYEVDENYSGEYDDSYYSERIRKYLECKRITHQLKYKDFYSLPKHKNTQLDILVKDIRESLGRGVPQLMIDRLHTYTVSFLRNICNKHSIEIKDQNDKFYSLTSLMGMLVKHYESVNAYESDFVSIALKSTISVFEKFNNLRNEKSYAHSNVTLNSMETEFALKSIINTLNFIDRLESMLTYIKRIENASVKNTQDDELPF